MSAAPPLPLAETVSRDRARAALLRDRALKPGDAPIEAATRLAAMLRGQHLFDEAQRVIARTQLRIGAHAALLHETGLIALDRNRPQDAAVSLRAALALDPGRAATRACLAAALLDLGAPADALRELDLAMPDLVDPYQARLDRAWALFALDRWAEGWEAYEARFDPPAAASPTRRAAEFRSPRWRGEAPAGALHVWSDRSLGEEILAASLLPPLLEGGMDLVFECSPRLAPLFARSMPNARIVPRQDTPPCDTVRCVAQIAAPGLFGALGWTPSHARPQAFLRAAPSRVAAARHRHAVPGRKLIGLSWASHAANLGRRKTLPLQALDRLTAISGAVFLDLQYGDTAETRLALAGRTGIDIRRDVEIDVTRDLDGLAALIGACDAIVTSSNVTAHLAGALGAQTHVLVPTGRARSWYWLPSQPRSPFYPRLTLHHQAADGSWRDAIDAVRAALTPPIR